MVTSTKEKISQSKSSTRILDLGGKVGKIPLPRQYMSYSALETFIKEYAKEQSATILTSRNAHLAGREATLEEALEFDKVLDTNWISDEIKQSAIASNVMWEIAKRKPSGTQIDILRASSFADVIGSCSLFTDMFWIMVEAANFEKDLFRSDAKMQGFVTLEYKNDDPLPWTLSWFPQEQDSCSQIQAETLTTLVIKKRQHKE